MTTMLEHIQQFTARRAALNDDSIRRWWADWRAYLDARMQLLDAQRADDDPLFEADDTRSAQQAAATTTIARIARDRRAVFAAVVTRDLAQAQTEDEQTGTHARDTDALEQAVLTRLRDLALGTHAGGDGMVPLADAEDGWVTLDVGALAQAPAAADYQLGQDDGAQQRRALMLAGLILGIGALALIAWALMGRSPAPRRAPAQAVAVLANGAAVEPWPWQTLTVLSGTNARSMSVDSTRAATWPAPDAATPQAWWRAPTLSPAQLCLPAPTLDGATALRVTSGPAYPDRMYTLTTTAPVAPAAPDLVLAACGGDRRVALHYGVLQTVALLPTQALAQPVAVDSAVTLTVRAITLTGPGADPTLPPGQATVTVDVAHATSLEWPTYAPLLTLASGEQLPPSDRVATVDGTQVRYLVPLPVAPLDVAWQVTPPGAAQATRWRTTLDVPPGRAAVLQTTLQVVQVTVTDAGNGQTRITLTLANRGDTLLRLRRDDLALAQQDRPLAIPDMAALQEPLAPQEQRTLAFTVAPPTRASLTLAVGTSRFVLTERSAPIAPTSP